MTKTFTNHDLLRYHYNELNTKEHTEISNAILMMPELQAESLEIKQMMNFLDGFLMSPSKKVVGNILKRVKNL